MPEILINMLTDADTIIKKYDKAKYKLFASKVNEIISSILQSKDIKPHSIEDFY